ncbi:MAG TPA: endonuclease/exonuclease/phosphatase family protein [Sphingobium sp.]|uniref:endonuclease/exonuclease/phosphatase family protein n=1 Tax=Sphingobium sp. TaxID=1912891 RepID=UPI002ED46928
MMKIASYNIRKAIGTDRRRSPERIIDVLNEMDADVIALQEADRRFGVRHGVLPDRLLEAHSPYRAVPLAIQTGSMGWHGNAVLVREGVEVIGHDVIHLPCLEPRGAVSVGVRMNGVALRLFGMHLDLSGLWRRRQAAAVLHHVDVANEHGETLPSVLVGDTNEWMQRGGCLRDFERQFTVLSCGRSFPTRRPVASLDRIMFSAGLQMREAGVHNSALARRASDHLPVWAVLEAG